MIYIYIHVIGSDIRQWIDIPARITLTERVQCDEVSVPYRPG